jgi:phage-related holin
MMRYVDYIYSTKFFSGVVIALPITTFFSLFEKYLYNDWKVMTSISIFVLMDTFLGVYKSWKYKCLSSRYFSKFFEKVIAYFFLLIISHHIGNYSINDYAEPILNTLAGSLSLGILIREAISIIENIEIIRPGTVPKYITTKFNLFDETGTFTSPSDNSNK